MKLGPLHLTWQTSQRQRTQEAAVVAFLADHPAGREVVARMARSEVKNYMAELAERAGVSFYGPAEFVDQVTRQNLVFHGPGCPGHTTGLPAESCMAYGKETTK